ncbi:hypothetical protein, partial [Mesorhizobium sp.]|uniref:hypothetical protein n=1 Tax=Mesorhizobium sp. TaxID=1871066 RepID=UPI0025C5AB26
MALHGAPSVLPDIAPTTGESGSSTAVQPMHVRNRYGEDNRGVRQLSFMPNRRRPVSLALAAAALASMPAAAFAAEKTGM